MCEGGKAMPDEKDIPQSDRALDAALQLANRIVGLVSTIIALGFVLILGLVVVYIWLVINVNQDSSAGLASAKIESLVLAVWDRVIPIATAVLRVVGPVLVLFLAFALLSVLAKRGASPLDLAKITSDLPSVLALLIIVTICILPVSGLEVPTALNNIALVVVGFYFGKRDVGAT